MTQYTVIAEVLTSLGIPVEAESPEAAIEQALTTGIQGLCHQCVGPWSGSGPRWWREEGDEWRETAVTDETATDETGNVKTVWAGPSLVISNVISHVRSLADNIERNNAIDPVLFLREYADQLEYRECSIETGDES